jgi:hypothetical protein
MAAKLGCISLGLLFALTNFGCANRDIFDCCDRYCYCADWANCHSCVNAACHSDAQYQWRP